MSEVTNSGQIMTNQDYHAHPAIGSTLIKEALRSAAHYLEARNNPREQTMAMSFGTNVHEAILEPDEFEKNVIVAPSFSGKGSVFERKTWNEANAHKRIISEDDYQKIMAMRDSIRANKTAMKFLSNGASEVSYFANLEGHDCKARVDRLREGKVLIDLKTTVDASPGEFSKAVANFGYHISAAFYLDVVSAATLVDYSEFIIIAIEKTPPYAIAVYLLDDGAIDAGRFLYKKALSTLAQAKATNLYPGYSEGVQYLSIPNWAFPSEGEG